MTDPALVTVSVRNVYKSFDDGKIPALIGADLTIRKGEFVAIMGPSGCGKSTLLHLIAALDQPDAGEIHVLGHALNNPRELDHYRARDIGIVFQMHNLLSSFTASENVQVPMFESRRTPDERAASAKELLALVGLKERDHQRPTKLSGGERQRVAIARALANNPPLLLADEPTGSLDSKSGAQILELLQRLRTERGLTIILVTHDSSIAKHADRIVRMLDGRVIDDGPGAHAA